MNAKMTRTKKIKKLNEATYSSKRVENKTHEEITEYRVDYDELTAMVTVTKKALTLPN